MPEPLRLGLVGVGAIAQSYLKALDGAGFARIAAVADTRPEAAAAAAEVAGCPDFPDAGALARSGLCDAVLVATPPATHAAIVAELVGLGLPVLCEKPLCIDVAEARALRDLAARRGALVTMASKFRFVPDVVRLKALIESGALGDQLTLDNCFASRVDMAGRWNSDPGVAGGGVVMDNGTHSVDIVRYLLGPVRTILAVELGRPQGLPVEDTAVLHASTEGGHSATIDLSWSFGKDRESFVSVFGSRGTAHIGWRGSRYRLHAGAADWVPLGDGYDKFDALRRQVADFCDAVTNPGRDSALVSPDDAVASTEVVAAAYASLASGRWERVGADTATAGADRLRVVS